MTTTKAYFAVLKQLFPGGPPRHGGGDLRGPALAPGDHIDLVRRHLDQAVSSEEGLRLHFEQMALRFGVTPTRPAPPLPPDRVTAVLCGGLDVLDGAELLQLGFDLETLELLGGERALSANMSGEPSLSASVPQGKDAAATPPALPPTPAGIHRVAPARRVRPRLLAVLAVAAALLLGVAWGSWGRSRHDPETAYVEAVPLGTLMGPVGGGAVCEFQLQITTPVAGYVAVVHDLQGGAVRVAPARYPSASDRDRIRVDAGDPTVLEPLFAPQAGAPARLLVLVTDRPAGEVLAEAAGRGELPGLDPARRPELLAAVDHILRGHGVRRLAHASLVSARP